jgi:2-polyprenyl-3-methyl-5-hydroxy-6-metoxy-1,4-benzoquinol methylase
LTSPADVAANPAITRWNEKYRNRSEGGNDTVEPKAELELQSHLDLLPTGGFALEVACGRGAHALYLATLGFDVVACDGAVWGLEVCRRSAARLNLSVFPYVCDLSIPALPRSAFDLVSVVRYLEYSAFDQIAGAVKPGGMLFYKTFNTRYLDRNPNFRQSFVVEPGELNRSFPELETLASDLDHQSAGEDYASFIIARKPG